MDVALWVAQVVLAAIFGGAGVIKATQPLDALRKKVGGWVDDVPLALIRVVGILEVVAAVGLLLPPLLDVAPALAWLAAAGLAVIMAGAVVLHARRSEWPNVIVNLGLGLVAVFVVWGRTGPHPF
ncbi:DoxX family protein [Aeromicrobium sp. CTD01-1L150]|uniref:DoxX family protein n=1 Tax=Aeromicrobium sp. CTD01-1L150 TaxID=3341830 RepID=UPI0035BF4DB0